MNKPNVFETPDFIYVMINNFPPYKKPIIMDKEKGVIKHRGRDGDYIKTNYVKYPTEHYTKEYVEKYIAPQYKDCPKCTIGELIVDDTKNMNTMSFKNSAPLIFFIGAIAVPLIYRFFKK